MFGEQVSWVDEAIHFPKLNGLRANALLDRQGMKLHMTKSAEA